MTIGVKQLKRFLWLAIEKSDRLVGDPRRGHVESLICAIRRQIRYRNGHNDRMARHEYPSQCEEYLAGYISGTGGLVYVAQDELEGLQ